jgi:hypothetical protein
LDFEDDIINSACVTHAGQIRHAGIQELVQNLQPVAT